MPLPAARPTPRPSPPGAVLSAERTTSDDELDGDALMLAWRAGDDGAFATIVEVFGPPLLRFLRRVVPDPRRAEDAWSETFYRVVRARDSFVPQGQFRAWLYSIGRRCGLDQMRTHRRVLRLANRLVERAIPVQRQPAPEVEVMRSERAQQLIAATDRLSEIQRTLLVLVYQEGMQSDEAGRVVGLTAQQVRNKTAYARRLLAEQLENPWEE